MKEATPLEIELSSKVASSVAALCASLGNAALCTLSKHSFTATGWTEAAKNKTLFAGFAPLFLSSLPTWTIYFTLYEAHRNDGPAYAAAVAGINASVLTLPIWNALAIYEARRKQSESDVMRRTMAALKRQGTGSLFKGLPAQTLLASHAVIQFPLYERLKSLDMGFSRDAMILPAALVSKAVACLATYPLFVIRHNYLNQEYFKFIAGDDPLYMLKRRMDVNANVPVKQSLLDIARQALRTPPAINQLRAYLVRSVPIGTLTLGIYEYVKEDVHTLFNL